MKAKKIEIPGTIDDKAKKIESGFELKMFGSNRSNICGYELTYTLNQFSLDGLKIAMQKIINGALGNKFDTSKKTIFFIIIGGFDKKYNEKYMNQLIYTKLSNLNIFKEPVCKFVEWEKLETTAQDFALNQIKKVKGESMKNNFVLVNFLKMDLDRNASLF